MELPFSFVRDFLFLLLLVLSFRKHISDVGFSLWCCRVDSKENKFLLRSILPPISHLAHKIGFEGVDVSSKISMIIKMESVKLTNAFFLYFNSERVSKAEESLVRLNKAL